MNNDNFNKMALKAGIWYVISTVLVRGISFITTPVFTRLLTQEQYGILVVYESWLRILFPIITLSLYVSVERAKYEFEKEYDAYISSIQIFMLLLCMGASIAAAIFHEQIKKLLDMSDIMLIIMIFYICAQAAINCIQRREKLLLKYKQNIVVTGCATVLPTIISMLFLFTWKQCGNVEDLLSVRILSFYIPQILVGMVLTFLILMRGHFCIKREHICFALKFCVPLIPHVLSMEMLNQLDKIMVKKMCGEKSAGIYSLATTVMWIVLLISQALGDAWIPWIYKKLSTREFSSIQKVWKDMICIFGFMGWIVVLFAPEIIWILGGKEYEDSVYLVMPLVISVMAHFFSYSYIAIEQFYKKTSYIMVISVIAVGLNFVLNYIGISRFGLTGAALATGICYVFMIAAHAFILKKKMGWTFISAKSTCLVLAAFSLIDMVTVISYGLPFLYRLAITLFFCSLFLMLFHKKIKAFATVIMGSKER